MTAQPQNARRSPDGPLPGTDVTAHYVLEGGGHYATVDAAGARLREFGRAARGVRHPYTETWTSGEPPAACGDVLFPWPNRIRDGRWGAVVGGGCSREYRLPVNEPVSRTSIHGLVRSVRFRALAVGQDRVMLAASVFDGAGYPFHLDLTVSYSVGASGLTVGYDVRNPGDSVAPFGIGAHPYLRVGSWSSDELELTIPGRTRAVDDDRYLPVSLADVAETGADFRAARRIGAFDGVVCYTDLVSAAAPGEAARRWRGRLEAPDGDGLTVWADESFRWCVLYVTDAFPSMTNQSRIGPGLAAPGVPRRTVAIEPMTCGVDAFNSAQDLLFLEPGARWSASWGLAPLPSAIR